MSMSCRFNNYEEKVREIKKIRHVELTVRKSVSPKKLTLNFYELILLHLSFIRFIIHLSLDYQPEANMERKIKDWILRKRNTQAR